MLAQLAQKLTVVTAERVRLRASRDQHPEHLVFGQQGRDDERAQPAARERTRKRMPAAGDIRLVHELTLHTAAESVRIDRNASVLGERHIERQCTAARPDARDCQNMLCGLVYAHAAEVDRQIVLEVADDDLEDAAQVLPLADGVRDPVQEVKPRELCLQLLASLLALRDVRDESAEGHLPVGAQRTDEQLCGKLGAVTTQAGQLDEAAQDLGFPGGEKSLQTVAVRITQPL